MDDTNHNRTSEAAAATRKRRSSILKSQRPPRTPFSELEFNVATPTDATKSRRVSFSRRTGVAEFITNEATTTWKNFYEEHNKSLESSGNESGANAPRPIGHIGKRIFDQQFQDVEAVDFGSTLDSHPRNINTSMNNVNYTEQFASLECTADDKKLSAPQQNFEMSAFTDHQSKLFGDDLALPTVGETSGRIDINFSAVQNIGEVKDDLDEIQDDLQRAQSNVVCPGPFTGRRSLNEYIEIDLNATHVTIKNDEDDMSITDTIHSPKVQEISKSLSCTIDKNASSSKDWVADKENIALNPYVTPKESTNFAINDDCDKVLVFDGKRLTIQSDKEAEKILKGSTDDLKPKEPKVPQRKTIVLNTNDDLPTFIDNPHMSTSNGILTGASFRHSVMYEIDDELTNESNILSNQKSMQLNFTGNISTTQAIPSNITVGVNVLNDQENSRVASDNMEADISMTQALPAKIIGPQEIQEPQRSNTVVYENNVGDISMTQAISGNILLNEDNRSENQMQETGRRRTILFDDDLENISMTQAVPVNILLNENKQNSNPESEKRRTIVFDDDIGEISMTQAVPANIIFNDDKDVNKTESERRKTVIYDNYMGNISVTQAIPANILVNDNYGGGKPETERRRTILYDNDMDNISMTQAIPANIILNQNQVENVPEPERRKTIIYDNDMGDVSITQAIPPHILINEDKNKTVVYDNIEADISMTQAIPSNLLIRGSENNPDNVKRRTIVFDIDDGDISVTKALPANIITDDQSKPEKRRTILFNNDSFGNISMTQAIPANIIQNEISKVEDEKRRVCDNIVGDISLTQTVPAKILPAEDEHEKNINIVTSDTNSNVSFNIILPAEKRKTIVFEDDAGNLSVTQSLPTNIFGIEKTEVSNKEPEDKINIVNSGSDLGDVSITRAVPANIIIPSKRNTIVFEDGNISVTKTLPTNIFGADNFDIPQVNLEDKIKIVSSDSEDITITRHITKVLSPNKEGKTIVFEDEAGNISVARTGGEKSPVLDKRKTILYESTSPGISVTQSVLVNVLIVNNATEKRKSIMFDTEMNDGALTSKAITDEENIEDELVNETEFQDAIDQNQDELDKISERDEDNISHMALVPTRPTIGETQGAARNEKQDTATNEEAKSSHSVIHIRDTDSETHLDEKSNKSLTWKDDLHKGRNSPLSLEYKEEVNAEVSANLSKLKLNNLVSENNMKQLSRSDMNVDEPESEDRFDVSKGGKSFKDANDTNELLEMLSDLTDKRKSFKEPEKQEKPVEKIESYESRRLSVAPSRLSIAISREDLMNNISMAHAALQKSISTDDEVDDTTSDTPIEDIDKLPTKMGRVSNEVVKKLQFEEDESVSDASIKSEIKSSPLKKTAFGETSYMMENKAKVIPSYLKDVSDEMKALMNDLVKPSADVPFPVPQSEKSLRRDPSTCSTQIQANLITSSQVDLDSEMTMSEANYDLDKESMPSRYSMSSKDSRFSSRVMSATSEVIAEMSRNISKSSEMIMEASFRPQRQLVKPNEGPVIYFDHQNPLNNVVLAPIDFSNVHAYNPPKSIETICAKSSSVASTQDAEVETINMRIVGNVTVASSMKSSGDTQIDKLDSQSVSNISKLGSIDEAVTACFFDVKDRKVNTVIAMKGNKELLEASSSLTLVDDAFAPKADDVESDMVTSESSVPPNNVRAKSSVKMIYDLDQDENRSEKIDADSDEALPIKVSVKGKKRIYSPANKNKQRHSVTSVDVTPKPNKKMQKLSNSPKYSHEKAESPVKIPAEKDEDINISSQSAMEIDESFSKQLLKNHNRKSPKSKKPLTSVTVQQLLTKYDMPDIDRNALNKEIIEALSRTGSSTVPETVSSKTSKSPDLVSSFTSSKHQRDMREVCSTATLSSKSRSGKTEWQPDVETDTSTHMVTENDSSYNVVAKIDMLPFMGSHECEWEASGADTWSFRLLHARLRLAARLAHRHDNAARTRVRADTPVLHVAVDTTHKDKKNSVAALCVGFALEAMRYFIGRGCPTAGHVPELLRRCAGVARVALRWGRAMHEAKLHLAYTLDNNGCLALKVANIPLRSVWEVTMRVALVVEDAREVPWPRACDVRVTRVVSDARVTDEDVRRALAHVPRDWGHAPRTIWKIFRYLKNKTCEDELLGM